MKEQIPPEHISIIRARPGDELVAADIAREAAEWLASCGIELWHPEHLDPAGFRERLDAGELYLAKVAGEPAGTMFLQWDDPICWPDMVGTGDSVYIHRLAVRRKYAGRGISQACFEFAKETAAQAGRKYLRLDTDAGRPRLCAVYERAGFTFHSNLDIGKFYIARYQICLDNS